MIVKATRFERLDHSGFTTSYENNLGSTVAYLDEMPDGTFNVFVYDAYTDKGRHYDGRTKEKAVAIIERHIKKLHETLDPKVRELKPRDPDEPIRLGR